MFLLSPAALQNPISSMSQNSVNLTIALFADAVAALLILSYLFFSFAAFQIAKSRGEKGTWLSFIPFAHLAYFSRLADEIQWKKKKQSVLFTLSIVATCGCIIAFSLFIINDRYPFLPGHSTAIFGSLFALFFVAGLVGLYWAAARLWKEIEPDQFALTLTFSILVPLCFPILLYRVSLIAMGREQAPPSDQPAEKKADKPFVVHLPDEAL